MVAPLDNTRPTAPRSGSPPVGGQPQSGGTSFEASLTRALTEPGRVPGDDADKAVLGDELMANLEQAAQSLRRASGHINAAKAYFQAASPPSTGLDAKG